MRFSIWSTYAYSSALACAVRVERLDVNRFSRLIVFGDSFSDNGNGSWVESNGTWPKDLAYSGHSFS
jgi:phospholipase/lecithinase/hemolysin